MSRGLWGIGEMLFLLNDRIVTVSLPEMHLERRWKSIGCGTPYGLRASEVVDFVQSKLEATRGSGNDVSEAEARDLAALIISRTGANSLILRHRSDGSSEPVLRLIPSPVLDVFARGASAAAGGGLPAEGEQAIAAN